MAKTVSRRINVFINSKEAGASIKDLRGEYRRLKNELERGVDSVEEYDAKTRRLRRLDGILKDHRANIRQVNRGWQGSAAGLGKLIGVAGAAFTAGTIVSLGKQLLYTATEMDTLSRKAQTVYEESLPAVTEAARENAAAMGLTEGRYLAAATAIADILVPMGFAREQAAEMSTGLVDLSGALSEWTGGQKSAAEVSQILAKALTGYYQ